MSAALIGLFCEHSKRSLLFLLAYLFNKPGFRILTVLLGNGFILRPHVVEEPGEVHPGSSIHFYSELAWAVRPEALELLGTASERVAQRPIMTFVGLFFYKKY